MAFMAEPLWACRIKVTPGAGGFLARASSNNGWKSAALSASAINQPTTLRLKMSMMT